MEYIREMFIFDRKTMGKIFYLPYVVWTIIFTVLIFFTFDSDSIYTTYIMIQGIFIPMCCWHLIFRYSEIFIYGAKDTLLPYYKKWIAYDFLSYGFIHVLLTGALVLTIFLKYDYLNIITILYLPLLIIFYLCTGAFLIFFTGSIEVTLTLICIYTVIEVVTQGTFMPWPRIFIFLTPLWDRFMISKFLLLGVIIIGLFLVLYRKVQRA